MQAEITKQESTLRGARTAASRSPSKKSRSRCSTPRRCCWSIALGEDSDNGVTCGRFRSNAYQAYYELAPRAGDRGRRAAEFVRATDVAAECYRDSNGIAVSNRAGRYRLLARGSAPQRDAPRPRRETKIAGKRILVVADGALQYLPFAALPIPGRRRDAKVPMVVEHEIVSLPSASVLAVLRRETGSRHHQQSRRRAGGSCLRVR